MPISKALCPFFFSELRGKTRDLEEKERKLERKRECVRERRERTGIACLQISFFAGYVSDNRSRTFTLAVSKP